MKQKKQYLGAFILLSFFVIKSSAQEATLSAGGEASGLGGSTSYSIGQTSYTTISDANSIITQGVQQPYEIYLMTDITSIEGENIDLSIYPNPTTDVLTLDIESIIVQNWAYELYNVEGKLVQSNSISDLNTQINMRQFAASTYFLRVKNESNIIQSFKIIKN